MNWKPSSSDSHQPPRNDIAAQTASKESSDRASLLRAMTGRDATAQLPVVTRTRRAIRVADESRREQDEQGRRQVGMALLVFGVLFVVLAPVVWSSIDDFAAGEHFGDLPTQVALLYALLTVGIFAALAAVWHARARHDEFPQE